MSNFGDVDYNQLSGMRKLFETAGNVAEQNAQLQWQVQQEKAYQTRMATAAEAYRQAQAMAERNPFVANRKVEDIAAGLLADRDPRAQKAAAEFAKLKFPTTPTVRSITAVKTPGYSEGKLIEKGVGTEGPTTEVTEIKGQRVVDPDEEALKKEELKTRVARNAAQTKKAAESPAKTDLPKVQDAYRQAHEEVKQLTGLYSEDKLKEWADIIEKEAPEFKAISQNEGTIDWKEFLQHPANGKLTEKGIDEHRLRAVANYLKSKSKMEGLRGSLKDRQVEYDEATDTFVPVGSKKPAAAASTKKKIANF